MNWRAGYELKPARQAKRKEADATGPQGGYGIRLALTYTKQMRCQRNSYAPIFVVRREQSSAMFRKQFNFI
jgi:hypothetical protein